jgi:hypothetical protein
MTSRPARPRLVAALALWLVGCTNGSEPAPAGQLGIRTRALGDGTCGQAVDPFTEFSQVTVTVEELDPATGEYRLLVKSNQALGAGQKVTLGDVPEGLAHQVSVWAEGEGKTWYGRDPAVAVHRDQVSQAELILAKHAGFTRVAVCDPPVLNSFPNVAFSSAVGFPDGRVMIVGGFQRVTAGGATLGEPSYRYFLYDARKGEWEKAGVLPGEEGDARGALGLAYLPLTKQVLVIGGSMSLAISQADPFPLSFEKNQVRNTWLLYDVATDAWVDQGQVGVGRVFPRLYTTADGVVLVSGGGQWPQDTDKDYEKWLFFVVDGSDGEVLPQTAKGFVQRAGHTITYVKSVGNLDHLLVWGGTDDEGGLAEVYVQSSNQAQGVPGTFKQVTVVGNPPPPLTYFHEMTALGGLRFLLTGGVQVKDGKLLAPADDEAWLLEYSEDVSGNPSIAATKVPGLGEGRFGHTALSYDGRHVVVAGGFGATGTQATSTDKVMIFKALEGAAGSWEVAAENGDFTARGGHAGVVPLGGAMFYVGGLEHLLEQATTVDGYVEIHTPSSIQKP